MTVVPPWSLDGRLAVITGFGAGIGRATATALARAGARIAGLEIDAQGGERAARELSAEGAEATFISCDTGDAGAIESAFATIAGHDRAGRHPGQQRRSGKPHPAGRPQPGRVGARPGGQHHRLRHSRAGGGPGDDPAGTRREHRQRQLDRRAQRAGAGQLRLQRGQGPGSTSSPVSSPWNGPDHGIRVNAVAPCQARTEAISSLLSG